MADVTHRASERGQLIIISTLALAILLSLMALALNTAVVGEVHVAQTDDSLRQERNIVQFQDAVRRGVKGLLPPIDEGNLEYDDHVAELQGAIGDWTDVANPEYARDAVVTNASLQGVTFDTYIVQNESGDFSAQNGSTSWTVAENVSDARGYEMYVSEDRLVETDSCTDESECFSLNVDGANGTWTLFVYTTPTTSVAVTVESGNGTEDCTATTSPVLINVSNGTFNEGGSTCEFTGLLDDDLGPQYTLTYRNTNNVSGTYELIVGGRIVEGTISDDPRYGVTGSPRLDPLIDTADVEIRYRSTGVTYRTSIEVTQEEEDG